MRVRSLAAEARKLQRASQPGPASNRPRRALSTVPGARQFRVWAPRSRASQQAVRAAPRLHTAGDSGAGPPGLGSTGGDGGGHGHWQPSKAVPAELSSPTQLQDVVLLDVAGLSLLVVLHRGVAAAPDLLLLQACTARGARGASSACSRPSRLCSRWGWAPVLLTCWAAAFDGSSAAGRRQSGDRDCHSTGHAA